MLPFLFNFMRNIYNQSSVTIKHVCRVNIDLIPKAYQLRVKALYTKYNNTIPIPMKKLKND